MNIKVGEYVRTIKGKIFKYGKGRAYLGKDNYVTKHSFNLIDLLEVGDIVEIELSEEFVERKDKKVLTQLGDVYTKETLQKDIDNGIIQEIKKVLTHQQFEANAYKTKGE